MLSHCGRPLLPLQSQRWRGIHDYSRQAVPAKIGILLPARSVRELPRRTEKHVWDIRRSGLLVENRNNRQFIRVLEVRESDKQKEKRVQGFKHEGKYRPT